MLVTAPLLSSELATAPVRRSHTLQAGSGKYAGRRRGQHWAWKPVRQRAGAVQPEWHDAAALLQPAAHESLSQPPKRTQCAADACNALQLKQPGGSSQLTPRWACRCTTPAAACCPQSSACCGCCRARGPSLHDEHSGGQQRWFQVTMAGGWRRWAAGRQHQSNHAHA